MELIAQLPVRQRFVYRVEVLALDVLDERHLEQERFLPFCHLANDNRHAKEAGTLRCAPAALASDNLKSFACAPNDDRLDDARGFDRRREVVQAAVVHVRPGLEGVRLQQVQVELDGGGVWLGRVGNERAQAFSESGTAIHIRAHSRDGEFDHRSFWSALSGQLSAVSFRPEASSLKPAPFYAAVGAVRSSSSRARARYASAPRERTS